MFGGVLEYAVLAGLVSRREMEAALAAGDIVRLAAVSTGCRPRERARRRRRAGARPT